MKMSASVLATYFLKEQVHKRLNNNNNNNGNID